MGFGQTVTIAELSDVQSHLITISKIDKQLQCLVALFPQYSFSGLLNVTSLEQSSWQAEEAVFEIEHDISDTSSDSSDDE